MVELNLHDIVKAENMYKRKDSGCGSCHSTYSTFFEKYNLEQFKENHAYNEPCYNGIYEIVGIGKHINIIVYVLEHLETKKIYLVNNSNNELSLYTNQLNKREAK